MVNRSVVFLVKKWKWEYMKLGVCVLSQSFKEKEFGTQAIRFVTSHYRDWDKITLVTPIDKKENVKFYTEKCGFNIVSMEMDGNVKVARFVLEK